MAPRDLNQQQQERDPTAEDEGEGIDFEHVKEMVGFVLRAPRRRPLLAIGVFTIGAALGVTAAATMPRTYNSQVKLLAQSNFVIPNISGRSISNDNPTKDLADQILRRDNIIALAKETDLAERHFASRSPALKLKDKLLAGHMTPEDKLKAVVATLEKNVTVTVQDSNVIIGVDWFQSQLAYDLVTAVQKNFQAAQYDGDVAMIRDTITMLQQHAQTEESAVDTELEEYRKFAAPPPVPSVPPSAAPSAAPPMVRAPRYIPPRTAATAGAAPIPIDPDLAATLDEKRQQIKSIEAERQRSLEGLRGQLTQAELTLTPQHPTVITLQQKIAELSAPDPHLAELKAEERALLSSIAPPPLPKANNSGSNNSGGGTGGGTNPPPGLLGATDPTPPPPVSTLGTPNEDPRAQLVRAKLEGAIRRYQDAVYRIDAANMELEILRTAFKYRYTVVTPAEVPLKPKKAVGPMVGVGSVIGSLLLALLLSAAVDLWSGRIIEEWQVRRALKLEILGEFDPTTSLPAGPS
jgi:hypothetical protein